ncbi:nucleotide-diphospho-sugar transferase [Lipomyces tetrasporus]
MSDKAYLTLLLTDTYLPGVLALAKALRDFGTIHQLAILIVPDALSPSTIAALEVVYDDVIRVPAIANPAPGNLFALGRADLYESFTKILAWNQTQYKRIVYLDADALPLANIDDLFDTEGLTAACPDAGWPDIFNSGVIVLTPSHSDFLGLHTLAESGESFDGGDQGLLNAYFGSSWTRLPFLYNVTPTTGYQNFMDLRSRSTGDGLVPTILFCPCPNPTYAPAFYRFSREVKVIHFIGTPKPWMRDRPSDPASIAVPEWYGATGSEVNNRLLRQWWAVYDTVEAPESVVDEAPATIEAPDSVVDEAPMSEQAHEQPESPAEVVQAPPAIPRPATPPPPLSFQRLAEWDPSRSSPPESSQGEAVFLPEIAYENAWDVPYNPNTDTIFVAPPIERIKEYTPHESHTPPCSLPAPPPPPPAAEPEYQAPSPSLAAPPLHENTYYQPQTVWNPPHPRRESSPPVVWHPPPRLSFAQDIPLPPPPRTPTPPPPPPPREPSPPPPPIFPWELLPVPPPVRVFPEDLVLAKPPLPGPESASESISQKEPEEDDDGDDAGESEHAPENGFGESKEFFEEDVEEKEDLAEEFIEDEREEAMVAAAEILQDPNAVLSPPNTAYSPLKPSPITSPAQTQRPVNPMVPANSYNAWDRDPHIVNYASHMSNTFFGGKSATANALTGVLSHPMPISPAPLRRASFFGAIDDDDDDGEQEEEVIWDPLKKLDELARLPALLLARHLEASSIAEADESTAE